MKLRWTKTARQDREDIYLYIHADNSVAALELDDRFDDRASQLTRLPHLGQQGRVTGTRELSISGSNYVVVYRVETDLIWIVRVIHTARMWPDEAG